MNKIDCSVVGPGVRTHYVDHIAPVWAALPEDVRGEFYAGPAEAEYAAARYGIRATACSSVPHLVGRLTAGDSARPVLVAGHADPAYTDRALRRNIVLMHGVGFAFGMHSFGTHPSYPGTTANRQNTILMLATNETIAAIERAANPGVRVEAVGCPKLDRWRSRRPYERTEKPVIACAWHWNCQVATAACTAFYQYKRAIGELARRHEVLGHGHPRIIGELAGQYEAMGIEVVRDLGEVFERADILIADATSAMFEAAAIGMPVVVADGTMYEGVDGGMFGLRHELGAVCPRPGALEWAVTLASADPADIRARREAAAADCYANLGTATEAAVTAILEAL